MTIIATPYHIDTTIVDLGSSCDDIIATQYCYANPHSSMITLYQIKQEERICPTHLTIYRDMCSEVSVYERQLREERSTVDCLQIFQGEAVYPILEVREVIQSLEQLALPSIGAFDKVFLHL